VVLRMMSLSAYARLGPQAGSQLLEGVPGRGSFRPIDFVSALASPVAERMELAAALACTSAKGKQVHGRMYTGIQYSTTEHVDEW